ncbi:hypothetical protein ACFL27_18590 [candidate division CSSED10-310 bacterium]|uniref:Glycosyltransferase RgtA/B/C/D-like domain-containing protein n=1 Tax=candidate division CSSED10-310 bacterium TaxID=2855610 RepID=A0ABV6Z1M6_UNCC1
MHQKCHYGLILLMLIFVGHAYVLNCVAEDAYISFRYARNLANGYGLRWNIDEAPVEGYTNFLWVIMCALAYKMGFEMPLFSQILGTGASLITLFWIYLFGRTFFDSKALYSLLPCLYLSLSGPFATWAASGKETNFFGLLVLIGIFYALKFWQKNNRQDLVICFITLFFATLVRPEGFLVFTIVLCFFLIMSLLKADKSVKKVLYALLYYLNPFLIYFIWRVYLFGFLLPNTYYAKTGGTVYQYKRGLMYSEHFVIYFVLPLAPIVVLLVWEKRASLIAFRISIHAVRQHLLTYASIYLCVSTCLIYMLYIILVGGDYMAMHRFFVPLLPLIYLLFGLAATKLLRSVSTSPVKSFLTWAILLFALTATVIQSTPIEKKLFKKPALMHGNYRGVEIERKTVARFIVIGQFFNKYKRDHESLATASIGAISYYAGMKIYSITGLVDTYIAHKKRTEIPLGLSYAGHEKVDLDYILSKKPTFIMLNKKLQPGPRKNIEQWWRTVYALHRFKKDYKLTSVWLVDETNQQQGYFTFLELKDRR